jgi:high-affinity nickel-transport protein
MLELGVVSGRALGLGMLVTAFVFGLRHGADWDHLAAITDLTGTAEQPRRSMLLATCYALGHAAVVLALGVGAVVFAERLPSSIDAVMERIVGATLLLLGAYVVVSLVRHGRDFRMRSRWMVVAALSRRVVDAATRRLRARQPREFVVIEHEHPHRHEPGGGHTHAHPRVARLAGAYPHDEPVVEPVEPSTEHRHRHRHVLPVPDDPFRAPGVGAALGIGALHGIGAETPTQVVVFVGAAGATGAVAGVGMLLAFVVGLLVSNSLIAAAATFGRLGSARRFPVYATVSVVTAAFSVAMGVLFLTGQGDVLPSILG